MKLLFLNGYFYPENIAYTHLEQDILAALCSRGHTVDVICPIPTRGVDEQTRKEYSKRVEEEMYDGAVKVHRFPLYREKESFIQRFVRYIICDIKTYFIAKKYKADVVFAVSTPPTQGFLAGKVAKKTGAGCVYNLQDVFPDSLITTGVSRKDSLIWKVGRKLEDKTYKNSDKIIVISQSMKNNIINKGVEEGKTEVISNWIDTDAVKPVSKEDNRLYDSFDIPRNKFIVVYAGNFGAAQGAEVVLECAKILSDETDIQFVIFGGGIGFENAKEKAKSLPNVIINPLLPAEYISEVYSLGDVALITCKKGVGSSGMPSKAWSIMACNTPVVASFDVDSELADIIKTAQAGLCVEPENAHELSKALLYIRNNGFDCKSRKYVCENASKNVCAEAYVDVIEKCKLEGVK